MQQSNLSTRRIFLQKGLTLLAVAPTIPTFLDQTVMALANPLDTPRVQQPNGKDGKILVVVQMGGGNDALSMVAPYADDTYHRLRPTLALGKDKVLKINDVVGLHPNLTAIKSIFDDGKMSIIQGVGYPNPNRSHFRSMDIWQSAQPEKDLPTNGWLGRYFDNTCPGCDPRVGISLGDHTPLAMHGDRVMPLNFDRPDSYRYKGKDVQGYVQLNKTDGNGMATANPPATKPSPIAFAQKTKREIITPASQLDFLHRTAMDAQLSSDEIIRITRNHNGPQAYPGGEFGNGLKTVAAMIAGGLPTRVYYVTLGGFDTHANQQGRHDQLMKQLSDGIGAFWADLKQQKNDDRVMMMTFSEFGRRVEQNASGGTDHGAAAAMFLMGPKLQQGVIGNHPSLTDLDHGDLRYGIDFRSVYATVLQDWLNTPSKPILGEQFKTMPMLKA